jgi:hydrogenase maturation protein HypF
MPESRRVRVRVKGVVQGVGFRPFIHRLALARGLDGWVKNDGQGVLIEAGGPDLDGFLADLRHRAPPLARIGSVDVEDIDGAAPGAGFSIRDSAVAPPATHLPADTAPCPACLEELFDPGDRRHLYPFITCTDCGARYTIADAPPFDRARTALADFPLCPECLAEYRDPANRRFHAQAMACPVCGPRLAMEVPEIMARIGRGEIVAVKGLGGFHLVCDARNADAVAALRRRKDRDAKPFAVMAANLASIARFAVFDTDEAALLSDSRRPIVLLPSRPSDLAPGIAPGLATIGVMLPYTPVHYLMFHHRAGQPAGTSWLDRPQDLVLVMTSANPGGEPLVIDEAGIGHLAGIADSVAGHDRAIRVRADDSVMRMVAGAPRHIRRARGWVPEPVRLSRPVPPILAVGGHLKTTICVTRDDEAFVSAHIGDLSTAATYRAFEETAARLLDMLGVRPERVAHDLHPDFLSTRHALSLGLPAVAVQHHHAHIAAIVAERRIEAPVLGLALDGFGLGPGGESWGGELLRLDGAACRRLGHLAPLPQPGGEAAARQPWRLGVAACHRLGLGADAIARLFPGRDTTAILRLLAGRAAPPSTSCGRLFDAAGGLLGIAPDAAYEGEAPMRLESLVRRPRILEGGWSLSDDLVLDPLPLLGALIGLDPADGADLFHGTLTAALLDLTATAAAREGLDMVVLAGGCLLNRPLAEGLVRGLAERGLTPLLPRALPPGDGGISLGQAWVAALSDIAA